MRDFPQELVFVFIFVAVWLGQLLYKLLRHKAAPTQADVEPTTRTQPASSATRDSVMVTDLESPAQQLLHGPTGLHGMSGSLAQAWNGLDSRQRPNLQPSPEPSSGHQSPASRRVQRYSRARLMPDRRAVQDAIVIAAILQPCLALQARKID